MVSHQIEPYFERPSQFYLVLLGFTGFYLVLLVFTGRVLRRSSETERS